MDDPKGGQEDEKGDSAGGRKLNVCRLSHHLAFVSSTFSEMECEETQA